jgi:hypothetical protein
VNYGSAIEEALLALRLSIDGWRDRGEPAGLLLGSDEPLPYENVPGQFRAFLAWGVDGVHEGLWIDDPHQSHAPPVVMASPMDFDEPNIPMAADVEQWLDLVLRQVPLTDVEWKHASERATERRRELGLPPIS